MFKLWSEINADAKQFLKPDLGLRSWDDLILKEKQKIWRYLIWYFFDPQIRNQYNLMGRLEERSYQFFGEYKEQEYKRKTIRASILNLNETFKAQSFAEHFLENQNLTTACYDFYDIFINQKEAVVMELLSLYAKWWHAFTKNDEYSYRSGNETEEDFLQRKIKAEFKYFDRFAERINEIFLQFGVKYHLARSGFVPRQDKKIIKEIYEPVLNYLSDSKWKKVNEILSDAFFDYRKNTPQGYSSCVTNTISAVEAYLQILVSGKIGGTKLSLLIPEAQKKNLIPNDIFTSTIFKNIEIIFARERKDTSNAHAKSEYATEKSARIILNLAMIFIQHCIQNQPCNFQS